MVDDDYVQLLTKCVALGAARRTLRRRSLHACGTRLYPPPHPYLYRLYSGKYIERSAYSRRSCGLGSSVASPVLYAREATARATSRAISLCGCVWVGASVRTCVHV